MKLDLPKTASYWPRNEETILKLCDLYGVNPKSLTRYPDLPWEEKYEKYVEMITGHKPCPICNGPMEFSKKYVRQNFFYPNGVACVDHPHHTLSLSVSWYPVNLSIRRRKDLTPEQKEELYVQAVANNLGPVCEHNEFLWDCKECSEEFKRINAVVENAIENNEVSLSVV
jgi:hypothetical protein